MGRVSKWVKPGWYLALCTGCHYFFVLANKEIRDDWAGKHEIQTRHYVDCIDGEEE